MELMGVYSGGDIITMARVGVDGVPDTWFIFGFERSSNFLFASTPLTNRFTSASLANFLACASLNILLASFPSVKFLDSSYLFFCRVE
jgi:hypothetical protein